MDHVKNLEIILRATVHCKHVAETFEATEIMNPGIEAMLLTAWCGGWVTGREQVIEENETPKFEDGVELLESLQRMLNEYAKYRREKQSEH